MTRITFRRLVLGGLLVLTGSCRKEADEAEPAGVVTAETIVVTAQPFESTIEAIGSVVAKPGHSAALSAPVSARIARVLVVAGQQVRAGQPLVELDRTGIDGAVRSAEATVAAADAAAARAERLVTAGVLPRRDAEQANAEAARARAELGTARRNAELARIAAPFNGVVTQVTAVVGATADPATPLVELTDAADIDVVFQVSPADAALIRLGQHVVMTGATPLDSLGVGTIADIGGVVDSLSRGVTVRASAGGALRPLRIGETINGQIVVGTNAKAIVVPITALVPSGEGFHLFVVDSAGIAHEREVTVDGQRNGVARITAGLEVGERVVTTGAYGLDDSVTVVAPGAAAKRP